MSAVPFSKISTPLNALFATIGLLFVATLTTHGLTGQGYGSDQLPVANEVLEANLFVKAGG
ncbi:hypothetical protein ACC811_37540, partial [Rhizobium ruizarguesonis]